MSFEITHVKKGSRYAMSERDLKDVIRCETCKLRPLCGGWAEFDDSRWCTEDCTFCRAVCCRNKHSQDIVRELGGLGINSVKYKKFDVDLPPVIPQINAQTFGVWSPAYVVSAKKLYYPQSAGWSKEKDLKKRFKIPPESKLILSFSVKDVILDSWSNNIRGVCEEISKYNIDYAIGMNFSVYGNYPPLDIAVSIRKRFLSIQYLQEFGVKVIPLLARFRDIDFKRHVAWFQKNQPSAVWWNMTMLRYGTHTDAWSRELNYIKKFREACGYPIKFIIAGASGQNRLKSIASEIPGVYFHDCKSYRFAEFHRKVWDMKWDKTVSVKDMFFDNYEYLTNVYESAVEDRPDNGRL